MKPAKNRRPILWCDGVHDDTEALQALIRGESVTFASEAGMVCEWKPIIGDGGSAI